MSPKFNEDAPAWAEYVANNGAHPRWLQELRRTPIVDFSKGIGRVGCVVRHEPGCLFLERIPKFVMANVPVWFIWNLPSHYHGTPCAVYRPSSQAVMEAQRGPRAGAARAAPAPHPFLPAIHSATVEQSLGTQSPAREGLDPPTGPPLAQPPAPDAQSGQVGGETVLEFMQRRAQIDTLREQQETPQERRTRMQRIASAETYALPGKHGARVFEWEVQGACWIRKAMTRACVEQDWHSMAPGHLRYNSFRNEWDYCELFDPSADAIDDEEYEELAYDYLHGQDVPNEAPQETPPRRRVVDGVAPSDCPFGTKNLDQHYGDTQQSGIFTQPETVDIVLASRYGFCGPPGPAIPEASLWHHTRKTLSDTQSPWEWPEVQGQVHNFVQMVCLDTVPPRLWDLDPASPAPVMFFNDNIVVERVTNGSRVLYRIVPRRVLSTEDPLWDLLVPDAITAVECIRRSHPSMGKASLVQFFAQTGRPFSTRMPICTQPTPPSAPRLRSYFPEGLGERHEHYTPDALDYKGYERDRAEFLQSDRVGAAIKQGGIVWRLAVEHLRLEDIMVGPLDLPSALYERFDGEPVGGWDDDLNPNELNLICGVYRIFTGKYNNAESQLDCVPNSPPQALEFIRKLTRLGGQRVQRGKTVA